MNDCKDVNQITTYDIENAIGEPRKQGATNIRNDLRVHQRNLFKPLQLKLKCKLKFQAQTRALRFIPIVCSTHFASGTRRKLQAVRHDPFFSCALT